jgi:hypothetical protein
MADEHRVIDISVEAESLPLSDLVIGITLEGDDEAVPPRAPRAFRIALWWLVSLRRKSGWPFIHRKKFLWTMIYRADSGAHTVEAYLVRLALYDRPPQ